MDDLIRQAADLGPETARDDGRAYMATEWAYPLLGVSAYLPTTPLAALNERILTDLVETLRPLIPPRPARFEDSTSVGRAFVAAERWLAHPAYTFAWWFSAAATHTYARTRPLVYRAPVRHRFARGQSASLKTRPSGYGTSRALDVWRHFSDGWRPHPAPQRIAVSWHRRFPGTKERAEALWQAALDRALFRALGMDALRVLADVWAARGDDGLLRLLAGEHRPGGLARLNTLLRIIAAGGTVEDEIARVSQLPPEPPRRVAVLGAPGAGKGTQAVRLAAHLGVRHLSTGDMLRLEVKHGSGLGLAADAYMRAGKLVPESIMVPLLTDRLQETGYRFLLDGYPRAMEHAETLDGLLGDGGVSLDAVLFIDVPDDVALDRIAGRRLDPQTGCVYNLRTDPIPSEVAGRLVRRTDDTEEACRARLVTWRELTVPLLAFYEARGLLRRVDGTGTPEEVEARIRAALGV